MDPITALGAITGVANTVDNLSGSASDRQQAYQMELMNAQAQKNKEAMEDQARAQREMYEYTGYESKVRQMKAAGLNPGLLYQQGGGGVTGNISAPQVSQGQAPNVAAEKQNKTANVGMALQLAKLQSEIDLNKSQADKNRAEAGSSGQNTETGKFKLDVDKETRQFEVTKRGAESSKQIEETFGKKLENDIRSQSMVSEIEARNQLGTEANLKVQQQIKDLAFTDARIALTESQQTEVVNRAMKLAIESKQIGRDYIQRQQAIEIGVTNFMQEMGMKKQFHNDEQFNEVARNVSHIASMAIGGAMMKGGK